MNPTLQKTIFVLAGVAVVVTAALVPSIGESARGLLFTVGGGLIGKELLPQSKGAP